MIVLDPSVAAKWFVEREPLAKEAQFVLSHIESDPSTYVVPELFMNELLAVLCRLRPRRPEQVREALELVEALGMRRIGNGHAVLSLAADLAGRWRLSGFEAIYAALASLSGGVWLTADARTARRVGTERLVRVLGTSPGVGRRERVPSAMDAEAHPWTAGPERLERSPYCRDDGQGGRSA